VLRYHRWLEVRTLTQYALLTGAYILLVTATVTALVWWAVPDSWLPRSLLSFALAFVPGFTVSSTIWQTRLRRDALRKGRDGRSQPGCGRCALTLRTGWLVVRRMVRVSSPRSTVTVSADEPLPN
jgi:hypothetical protein